MESEKRIPTNLHTLLILEVIGRSERALTPTEINEAIGLPKQTIHRLVATLVEEGFLVRDADRNRFRPTRRLRLMGAGLLHASRANMMRHQILEQVAKEIGESVNFVIPEEQGMNYLDRVETDWPFRIQLPRGSHVPFHTTASGKSFIASLPSAQRKKFITSLTLDKWTEKSIITEEELLKECKKISSQGFAADREEFIDNMVALAVPILDAENRFVAALATHGPKDRLDAQDQDHIVTILQSNAERLRRALLD